MTDASSPFFLALPGEYRKAAVARSGAAAIQGGASYRPGVSGKATVGTMQLAMRLLFAARGSCGTASAAKERSGRAGN